MGCFSKLTTTLSISVTASKQFRSYKISESFQLVMSHVKMMPSFLILLSSLCLLASSSTSDSKDLNVYGSKLVQHAVGSESSGASPVSKGI